jgi:hypothetical protein
LYFLIYEFYSDVVDERLGLELLAELCMAVDLDDFAQQHDYNCCLVLV